MPRLPRLLSHRAAVTAAAVTALGASFTAEAVGEPEHVEPPYGTLTIAITGDPVLGSQAFKQALNEANVGDEVRFANTSHSTAYIVAERSGLFSFDVAARGEARRVLEAGTHEVHDPRYSDLMHAKIRVPPDATLRRKVTIRRTKRGIRTRKVVRTAEVRWATVAPQAGHAFEVERRRGRNGPWQTWHTATTAVIGRFTIRAGDSWRVRVRTVSGEARGSWSPSAAVVP